MRLIDHGLIDALSAEASRSPRRRAIHRFHEHEEPVQRMINALRDDSYVQPHRHADPDKVERDLERLLPKPRWVFAHHALILHGRRVCGARKPNCGACSLVPLCPSSQA